MEAGREEEEADDAETPPDEVGNISLSIQICIGYEMHINRVSLAIVCSSYLDVAACTAAEELIKAISCLVKFLTLQG